jgi:hypothetical protein
MASRFPSQLFVRTLLRPLLGVYAQFPVEHPTAQLAPVVVKKVEASI